jgi:hypothetical protein
MSDSLRTAGSGIGRPSRGRAALSVAERMAAMLEARLEEDNDGLKVTWREFNRDCAFNIYGLKKS